MAADRRLRALVSRTSQGLSCRVTAASSMTCAPACGRARTRTTASAPLQSGSMPMTSSGLSVAGPVPKARHRCEVKSPTLVPA